LGADAQAIGDSNTAAGASAMATGIRSTALGAESSATNEETTAVGYSADSTGFHSTAIGALSDATGLGSTAVGWEADATGARSTALGNSAKATAADSTALGRSAMATGTNSVAIGVGSVATQANTVSVGTVGGERRVVNVAAGTAGTDAVNVSQLNASNAAITNEATARQAGDAVLGTKLDDLSFDLRRNGREARAGTSAALAAAALPQAMDPGRSMIAAGMGTYRGRAAFAIGASHRLSGGNAVVKVGVTYDTSEHVGANAGVGFQF
jgi:autotransporter adhesin